jgi:hypothetical protein
LHSPITTATTMMTTTIQETFRCTGKYYILYEKIRKCVDGSLAQTITNDNALISF